MSNFTAQASVTIQAPLSQVWQALTEAKMVKQYLFGTDMETTWKVGSPILFKGQWEGKAYADKGTVLNFQPEETFSYSYWSNFSGTEDKPENYQNISFDLKTISDGQVEVTVTQENASSQESANHSAENWKKVLDSMKKLLEAKS